MASYTCEMAMCYFKMYYDPAWKIKQFGMVSEILCPYPPTAEETKARVVFGEFAVRGSAVYVCAMEASRFPSGETMQVLTCSPTGVWEPQNVTCVGKFNL